MDLTYEELKADVTPERLAALERVARAAGEYFDSGDACDWNSLGDELAELRSTT